MTEEIRSQLSGSEKRLGVDLQRCVLGGRREGTYRFAARKSSNPTKLFSKISELLVKARDGRKAKTGRRGKSPPRGTWG